MQTVVYNRIFVFLYLLSVTAGYGNDNCPELLDYEENIINFEKKNINSTTNKTKENCNKCGIGTYTLPGKGRIVNGRPVLPVYKYPWIVTFFIDERKMRLCGGALISENFVLTAAHCVFRVELKNHPFCFASRVHKSCFRNPEDIHLFPVALDPPKPLKVKKIIGHPKYSLRWDTYDIALIQLSEPLQCSKKIMPVCLSTKNLEKLGQKLIIAGSGANTPEGTEGRQILREGLAKVVNPKLCHEPHQPKDFHQTIICAVAAIPGQMPCYGDSGSAIFGHFEKKFYALGITSKANSPLSDTPDTFTKIFFFMDWIKIYVGKPSA